MMGLRRLSIRLRLYLAFGCLALIAVCALGTMAWQARNDDEGAEAAYQANAAADLLLQAAGSWAAERGLTNTALNAASAVSAETRAAIDQRRVSADKAAGLALSAIAGRREVKDAIAKLDGLRQALSSLRGQSDTALAHPLPERAKGPLDAWFRGITSVIEASQRLRQDTAFYGTTADAQLASLQQMKQATWVVSEYAGRERAVLGGIIAAGRPIAADRLLELGGYRGKVEMAWNDIQSVIASMPTSASVRNAADATRDAFFARFQDVRARVYSAGLAGADYPLSAQAWVADATAAIDTVLQLSRATGELAAEVAAKSAASQRRALWVSIGALGLSVASATAFVLIVSLQVLRPLTQMSRAARLLAAGELQAAIPCQEWTDELGDLAASMAVLRDGMLQKVELKCEQEATRARLAAEEERSREKATLEAAEVALVVSTLGGALERLATRDLTSHLTAALPANYDKLRLDLNATTGQLQAAMTRIVASMNTIRSGTGEIAQASDDLSRRTEQQAATLEQTAAALDEITATVRKTAESAARASLTVSQTKADAEQSGEVVRQAVGAMSKIEQSSHQISQIIGVIDEIAFQTNLLALNAGVEAARAGDSGRGFAVVATEVRALAQRSAAAAKEIKALISSSAEQVGYGVTLVGEAGRSLLRIVSQVTEITVAVSDMANAAKEQATGLHEVNVGINHMDQVTQQNAAMVEQSTAATHALAQETAELAQLIAGFELGEPMLHPGGSPPASRSSARAMGERDQRPRASGHERKLSATV